MKIFFDLDGTLLDSRRRLYWLFQHLVPSSKLSFQEYWKFKRNKIGHREILSTRYAYSEDEILRFEKIWLETIELPEWLAFDKPFEGVTEYLKVLKNEHLLYIVTARQFEENALAQLGRFGWLELFEKILVTNQKEKTEMVRDNVITERTDWFVGDTGLDIQAGKKLGVQTAAVLSGFLSKEKLLLYEPDMIVNSVLEFNI